MGVWGTGIFDNDEALDLCYALETRGICRLRQVLRALTSVPAGNRIDEDQACQAVAAAAVLAYASGLNVKGVPDEIRELLDLGRVKCSPNDLLLVQDALKRVLHHSWLAQAWRSSDRKRWRQQVRRLLMSVQRLQTVAHETGAKSMGSQHKRKRATMQPKKSPKLDLQAGDIVLIPVSVGEWVVTKVLFVSKFFRHCILIGVTNEITRSLSMPASQPARYTLQTYTTDQELIEGIWHKVGNLPLSEQERQASLRLVGDEVWLGDKLLRKASKRDMPRLPQMSPGGGITTEYEIQVALGRLKAGSVQDLAKVWHLRGLLYLQRNEPKKALEYLNQALTDDSQLAVAYWDRAKAWEALGKRERAEQDREKALSIDPSLKR